MNSLMRVLLVEDDVPLRQALVVFFRSAGIDVIALPSDGQEALDMLGTIHPDLIITDCQMPRMDGISLVRHLRARGDQTPVIMMSGQHDPRVREMALKAGVAHYLDKPLSLPALNSAIANTAAGSAA